MPEVREAGGAVEVKIQNVRCPRCGSPNLTDDDAQGVVYCTSCGYQEEKNRQSGKLNSLAVALIKRRSQPVVWMVGERWLKCRSCGSTRTIPAEQLAETCPFCGSKNVIEQDALNTFQQPEGIIPFALSEKQAMTRVEEHLNSFGEKFKGFFNSNRVKRSQIEGVFLPFWIFDAVLDIQRSTIDTRGTDQREYGRFGGNFASSINPYRTETIPEMANNVLICAVSSPPRYLTTKLGKYRLERAVDYEPKLLAQHAAEIYSLDFDKAALDAHEVISDEMHRKYRVMNGSSEVSVTIMPMIKHMMFHLLLLPVYSVTLFEVDGEVRPVLVNGQTGEVIPGKARKPER
jgi:DNA-directed RNA polymerase subunit M/transcription elongation factor TFIIS